MAADAALDVLTAVAARQNFVLHRQQALAAGITADRWQGRLLGRLVPLLRGTAMLVMPGAPTTPTALQWARAALLCSPTGTSVCLGSALRVQGISGTPHPDLEHVLLPAAGGWAVREGLARHSYRVQPRDLATVRGLQVTGVTRSVFDAMRTYDREHAVSVLDSALALGRLSEAGRQRLTLHLPAQRRGWLELADARAESPLETRGRLFLIDRRLPFESQVTIDVPGYGIARADFRVGRWVLVECDGRGVHDELKARYVDRRREDALRTLGFEVVRVTWGDLLLRPDETFARICAALQRVG